MGALGPEATAPGPGPVLIALAIAGPVALSRVVNHLAAWPGSERQGRSWALQAVLLLQFLPLTLGFRALLPDPRARQAHDTLVERLRALPDSVLAPGFGFLAQQAGKGAAYDPLALEALVEARGNRLLARDPGFVDRLFAPLESGPGRPLLLTESPIDRLAASKGAPWPRVAADYRRSTEWAELAGTQAPRFVSAPLADQLPGPAAAKSGTLARTSLAGSVDAPPDSASAR